MALIPLSRALRATVLATALGALAACGTGRDDPIVSSVRGLTERITSGFGGGAEPGPTFTAETLPAEIISQFDGPLIVIESEQLGAAALMVRVGQNRGVETWRAAINQQLSMTDSYVLRSTRGFGFDLMASDARSTEALLRARQDGSGQRLVVHLDGNIEEIRRIFDCTVQRNGTETVRIAGTSQSLTKVTETCQIDGAGFVNTYWLDRQGRAIQSRQWVSETIGYLRISVVSDG